MSLPWLFFSIGEKPLGNIFPRWLLLTYLMHQVKLICIIKIRTIIFLLLFLFAGSCVLCYAIRAFLINYSLCFLLVALFLFSYPGEPESLLQNLFHMSQFTCVQCLLPTAMVNSCCQQTDYVHHLKSHIPCQVLVYVKFSSLGNLGSY